MEPIFLSVVIPAYNEAKRIGVTLQSLDAYFKDKEYPYEIIVVNDGSTDETAEIVSSFSIPHLKLMTNSTNSGKGYAVQCGMFEAMGTYRIFMDADNSITIDTVEGFLTEMQKGADVVIGSIALKTSQVTERNQSYRRLLGALSKGLIRELATPGIYDTQRGFKLFTADAADTIFPRQTIKRFGFDIELLVIAQVHGWLSRKYQSYGIIRLDRRCVLGITSQVCQN